MSHKQTSPNAAFMGSAEPRDEKAHGSVNLKHQRSGLAEDSWRSPKMPRPGEVDFSSKKATESFTAFGRSNLWPSPVDDGQKMLSFSSSDPHCGGGMGSSGSSRSIAFSICQDENNSRTGGTYDDKITCFIFEVDFLCLCFSYVFSFVFGLKM